MPSGGTRAASPTILGFSLGFAFSLVGVGIAYLISVDNASGRTWRWFRDDSFEALGVIGGFAYLAYQVFHDGNLLVTFTRPVALAVAIALGYWWKRKSAGEPANRRTGEPANRRTEGTRTATKRVARSPRWFAEASRRQ